MPSRPCTTELRKERIDRKRKTKIMKMCSRCKLTKSTNDFYTSNANSDGYSSYCKECKHTYYIERKRKLTAAKAACSAPKTYPNEFLKTLDSLSAIEQEKLLIDILYDVKNVKPESIPIDTVHKALIIGILLYPRFTSETHKKTFKKAYQDATRSEYYMPLASVAPKIPELRETKARELLKTLLSFYTAATERLASGQTAYEIILTNPQP